MSEVQNQAAPGSPQVTLCLAVYQSERFLEATLASIAAQSFPHFRCVISDDASNDRTVSICRQAAQADARFEVLENTTRLGWIGNVNRTLERVGGEFFMIASHDDVLEKTYLESLWAAMQSRPKAAVAYSDLRVVRANLPDIVVSYTRLDRCATAFQRAAGVISQEGRWWIPYRGLVRGSLLPEPPRLHRNRAGEFSADLPWVLSLALAGELVRVPGPLLVKFKKPGSVSALWAFRLREHAAALESCAGLVWRSSLPSIQRASLLLLVLLRLARKTSWDAWKWLRKITSGGAANSHDEHRSG